jgi:putative FmdB family regulatory protein
VATYEYRCPRDGDFEARFPLGEAAATVRCATCRGAAGRVFSAPLLARTPRPLTTAIDRGERSADTPDVVSRIPPRRRATPRPANPAHARLPRP